MTTNHNIQKPRLTAGDMTLIQKESDRLTSWIDDFVSELAMEIAEREFDIADEFEKADNFAFLDIMPVITDMILQTIRRDI